MPPWSDGTGNKPTNCAGCERAVGVNTSKVLTCAFNRTGFAFESGEHAVACRTVYHPECVRMGQPFTTRLRNDAGLHLPAALLDVPTFICEACTVRGILQRELTDTSRDRALLCLERARLIDMAHKWASGTHKQYQSRLRLIRRFEGDFGIPILRSKVPTAPPRDPSIPLMWVQQQYSLRPGRRRDESGKRLPMNFNTVRALRSAAQQYFAWDMQVAFPSMAMLDPGGRPVLTQGCLPTDALAYNFMTAGQSRRLGEDSRPSTALLHRHIAFIDAHLAAAYDGATTHAHRAEIARAGLATTVSWLAWLRAVEVFGLRWCDIAVVEPGDGGTLAMPDEFGAVTLRLDPQTKSDPTRTADVVLAYTTSSGLSPGRWLHRLREALGDDADFPSSVEPIFQTDGRQWTSYYYRSTYLYPLLHVQRLAGDKFLAPFDGSSPNNTIEFKFWSMHSFRRGARSHVSRKRPECIRKATDLEVKEHGRWRTKRSAMDMPTLYNEWSIFDRLALTLFCM